jgi:hypothetical protein
LGISPSEKWVGGSRVLAGVPASAAAHRFSRVIAPNPGQCLKKALLSLYF